MSLRQIDLPGYWHLGVVLDNNMEILNKIFWFLIAIGVLVIIHELGHYSVGKLLKVKVLRFSIGFGKPIFSKKLGKDNTLWSIGAIPLGGYVDFSGMRPPKSETTDTSREFYKKPILSRAAIVIAGPLANFLLAVLLYWGIFVMGSPGIKPIIDDPLPESFASKSELYRGDIVLKVNESEVNSWSELRWKIIQNGFNQDIRFLVKGAEGKTREVKIDLKEVGLVDSGSDPVKLVGIQPFQVDLPPDIGGLVEGGAAYKAGMLVGDRILEVGDSRIFSWKHLVQVIKQSPGQALAIKVDRAGVLLKFDVVIDSFNKGNSTIGRLGIRSVSPGTVMEGFVTEVSYTPGLSLLRAIEKTWEITIFSIKMIGKMILGEVALSNLSGPVTIADYAGQTASYGFVSFLGFLALISISLGIVNLLPIPMLDGGWLVHLLVEFIKGSALSDRTFIFVQSIGMSLIGFLFLLAIYNDLVRIYSG